LVSPIALFAYNRPEKLKIAIESLSNNELSGASDLYVFVDGPKSTKDAFLIQDVIEIIQGTNGFKSINLHTSEINLGLASSVRKGIDFVLSLAPTVVVIEDDLIIAPSFLEYVNEGLSRFKNDKRVASIQGYQYPIVPPLQKAVALRGADCWGWATWKDRWHSSIFDAKRLYEQIKLQNLQYEFDLYGAMPYTHMLKDQIDGKIDSWAICWHASMFIQDRVSLYPAESLIFNNGHDGKGTHGNRSGMFDTKLGFWSVKTPWPNPVQDIKYRNQLQQYYQYNLQMPTQSLLQIAKSKLLKFKGKYLKIWNRF
jgi:glycosyltransferase involved in cell wall biosynthesis